MHDAQAMRLPKLREDLQLLKGAPTITGKPTWLVFDPVAHRYFQIDQDAFRLFHDRQFSYSEIASELDVPIGTIKTWVHRARKQIAETLQRRRTLERD